MLFLLKRTDYDSEGSTEVAAANLPLCRQPDTNVRCCVRLALCRLACLRPEYQLMCASDENRHMGILLPCLLVRSFTRSWSCRAG